MTVVCNECGSKSPKYRFKCCLLQFCSQNCYKAHSCASKDQPTPSCSSSQGALKSEGAGEVPSGTKLTDEQLDILKSDSTLRDYLKDDKLKLVLVDIASSEDPMERSQRACVGFRVSGPCISFKASVSLGRFKAGLLVSTCPIYVVKIQLQCKTSYKLMGREAKSTGGFDNQINSTGGQTVNVTVCEVVPCPALTASNYKCFKHGLTSLGPEYLHQIGGVKLYTRGREPGKEAEIKLKNGQAKQGAIEPLYYNKCMGDIYVYFYGSDPRPLLLCYNKEAYCAKTMQGYDKQEWYKEDEAGECKCTDPPSDQDKLLKALVKVSDFLNPVKLHIAPSKAKRYTIHRFNGLLIWVKTEIKRATDSFCYHKYTHTHYGIYGDGSGFRLGDIVYYRNGSGGSRRTGSIKYYQNGSNGQQNGNLATPTNKYKPLTSVIVYYYTEDTKYEDPLLVVLEFATNGVDSSNNENRECYKLTNTGPSMAWEKDEAAKNLVDKDNGELARHLDGIRYCLKYTIRIHLECQTGYELKGRTGGTSEGTFNQEINGDTTNGQVNVTVKVCDCKCPSLTGSHYKCVKHKLGEALTGKQHEVAGLAFTLPCENGAAGQSACCVNGGTSCVANGFVEIPVCIAGQEYGKCGEGTKTGCTAVPPGASICPAVTTGAGTCPAAPAAPSLPCTNGKPGSIPPILYNSCMGDVCVYFYACKNGGSESCAVSTDATGSGSCSQKNGGTNDDKTDTVPLMVRFNGRFYRPCDRDQYFTKWVCVTELCKEADTCKCVCCCGANADGGADCTATHGTGCTEDCDCCKELVNKLNEVNEALNRIDLDKSSLANGSSTISNGSSKGYGLPETCDKTGGVRGCKLTSEVCNYRICLTKQDPTGDGANAYVRVIHRTKNGFHIGDIKYCGQDITSGITPNGQNGDCTPGISVGAICPSTSSSTSSDCTIKVANGNNHQGQVRANGWNTVAVYYSTTDTGKKLPQLIVILKTDCEVKSDGPVNVSGGKYGYYILASRDKRDDELSTRGATCTSMGGGGGGSGVGTCASSSVVSASSGTGTGYEYQYWWVDVNSKEASGVKLDDETDFRLLNSAVVLLNWTDIGGGLTCLGMPYGDTQLQEAVRIAARNGSLKVSPGSSDRVNRLQHRDITVKDETNGAESAQGVGTCPCPCKCLKEAGFKMMSHDLSQLVKLNGQFKGKLCNISLIAGLKFLIPTRNRGQYKQLTLKDNNTGGDVQSNGAGSDNIKYHKNGNNKIYVFFYDKDPRPLLFCYNKQAYAAISMKDYDDLKWTECIEVEKCDCSEQPAKSCENCKLLTELVKVSDFLNPVRLDSVPKSPETFRTYYVHGFNGQRIMVKVEEQNATDKFCYNRYTHKHYGTGRGGTGFRLGNIYHGDITSDKNCIKENGSKNANGNGKCISASDIDNKDNKHSASPEVVVFYYRGDSKHQHPLLVALKSHDQGTNGKYTPYFELQKKVGAGDQKKYTKNNGDGLDLSNTKPDGELARKLDSILFTISTKLQIVLAERPLPTKYSPTEGYSKELEGLKDFREDKQKDLTHMAKTADEASKSGKPTHTTRESLMHHVLRTTEYQAQLCDNGPSGSPPSSPPTDPKETTITVKEVDCPEIHSQGGYRCFKHDLVNTEHIEQVGGLKLAVFDGPGGAGTREIALCTGQTTSNGQPCKNGKTGQPVQLSYTTCKGDLYVFFYGEDPRPMMLCYDGHAYRPTSMDTYCREWVKVNNGTTGAKNGQGTPVDCLCQDAGGGGQKPKFNTQQLLNALYRVSLFLNPVRLCLTDKAITAMKAKQSKHEWTYPAHDYKPETIRVIVKAQDLSCYRVYTHQPVKQGFRLGRVTYAEAKDECAAQTPGKASCSASTAGQQGQQCSQGTPGTTTTPYCFAYDCSKQLWSVSVYYYMYDKDHKWPLVVELGFRGQSSEFFRLCCKGDNSGQPGSAGNGVQTGNGNNGAQTTNGANGCKSPKGLKWVRMSHTTEKGQKSDSCANGTTSQDSNSTTQNGQGECVTCPPNTQGNNNNQSDEKAETCRLDREFVKEAERLYRLAHGWERAVGAEFKAHERDLEDLVERRAYQIRKGLKLEYDKEDKNLILATASNCWEGWP